MFNLKSNKEIRRRLRKNLTKAEIVLWQILRRKQLGFKFRRQFGIGPFIVDFYCPQLRLVIELDGAVHTISKQRQKDKIRQEFLENYGCYVKRYWNNEILDNTNSAAEEIYYLCKQLSTSPEPLLKKEGRTPINPTISSLDKEENPKRRLNEFLCR